MQVFFILKSGLKGTPKLQGIKNFQNVKCVYFNPILMQILFYELLIFPVLSSCMTYHQFVTRLTPRVPLVEKELPTLSVQEHLSSPSVFLKRGLQCSIFNFLCMFCRSFFVLFSFCNWPLYSLSFFDLQLLIAPFGIFKLF